MSDAKIIAARNIETEITECNSRFITRATPTYNVKEEKAFINIIVDKFLDVTHNVTIYYRSRK